MCFSPAVSFAASAGLAIIGSLTALKVLRRREWFLASIPFFFAGQQLIEGMLWLALRKSEIGGQHWLTQSYVVFVGMLWPILIPFSLWMIEPQHGRRRMMLAVLMVGMGIAFYTGYGMLRFPVTARIGDHCIVYDYPVAQPRCMLAFYVIATCAAFFFSSHTAIMWLGVVNMAAFAITHYFYLYDLTSVWCFFAAIISGLIYLYFYHRAKYRAK